MRSLSTRATGLLILVLGAWGGIVPFIGHYFHFALGPDKAWTWTTGRLYLSVLPAAAAVLGGLMLIGAGWRRSARLGALLAIAAGIWFAIGPDVSHLWNAAGAQGAAHGSKTVRVIEMLAYHSLLGALLAALGGYALPRFIAAPDVVAEPAAGRRATGRHVGRDAALAGGGAVAAERVHEHGRARDERELDREREPATTAMPVREEEGGRGAVARDAETAPTSRVADRDVERAEPSAPGAGTSSPAADAAPVDEHQPDAPATRDAGVASREEPVREPVNAPAADDTGQPVDGGGAAPTAPGGAGAYGTSTTRRRRGGLLSAFRSRR